MQKNRQFFYCFIMRKENKNEKTSFVLAFYLYKKEKNITRNLHIDLYLI